MGLKDQKEFFPIDETHLKRALLYIKKHAVGLGFSDNYLKYIELAAEEALLNIINYSGLTSLDYWEIHCQTLSNGIAITISDLGKPFNPLFHLPLDTTPDDTKVGGQGLKLMYQLMDQLQYHHIGGFNVLTLIKTQPNSSPTIN